jgi:hypothetical protein
MTMLATKTSWQRESRSLAREQVERHVATSLRIFREAIKRSAIDYDDVERLSRQLERRLRG